MILSNKQVAMNNAPSTCLKAIASPIGARQWPRVDAPSPADSLPTADHPEMKTSRSAVVMVVLAAR